MKCFMFLKAFAKSNLEVQRSIYERMDEFLDVEVYIDSVIQLTIVLIFAYQIARTLQAGNPW